MKDRESERAPRSKGKGRYAFLAALAIWWLALNGLVSIPILILLMVLGAMLVCGGLYLAFGSLPHVFESPWYAGTCVLGLAMLVGAAATLAPAAPGELLARYTSGWLVLEFRVERLEQAIEQSDSALAGRIARRGLGDPAARDISTGIPLLHYAKDPEMVGVLLAGGLDPDARDPQEHTLLMKTRDLDTVRKLLEAGADPNARDRLGSTVLMRHGSESAELIELLLEAGADVHATDDSGRTVADLVRGPGRSLLERYAGDRPLAESGGVMPRGMEEWLTDEVSNSAGSTSSVTLEPSPLRPGGTGTVTISIGNVTPEDRLLDVRAELNSAVFFVAASHGGIREDFRRPGLTGTVRWPLLALPAGRRGTLEIDVLVRSDDVAPDVPTGDLSADVSLLDLPQRTEEVLQLYQARADPDAWASLSSLPGVAVFLVPLLVAAVVWLLLRRRRGKQSSEARDFRFGRIVALGAALLCAWTAALLVWETFEPYVRFQETSCQVLDRRVLFYTTQSSTTGSSTSRSRHGYAHTTVSVPLATVRIDTGEEPLVTAGISSGMGTRFDQDLRMLPADAETTCWLDPDDSHRFTFTRGTGVGTVIGLGLLLVTALGLFGAARVLKRLSRRGKS